MQNLTLNKNTDHHRGGWKLSDKVKNRMSVLAKQRGFGKWMLGKKLSPETCLKKSLAQRGEKGSNWKGGLCSGDMKKYHIERKHRLGINKKYKSELGLSYTPAYRRLQKQRRKALERGNGGRLSIKTIHLVYEDNIKKHGTLTCYLCLKPIEFSQDCLEHKTPLTRGGSNLYENLAIAHQSCNKKKHAKTEKEYRVYEKSL